MRRTENIEMRNLGVQSCEESVVDTVVILSSPSVAHVEQVQPLVKVNVHTQVPQVDFENTSTQTEDMPHENVAGERHELRQQIDSLQNSLSTYERTIEILTRALAENKSEMSQLQQTADLFRQTTATQAEKLGELEYKLQIKVMENSKLEDAIANAKVQYQNQLEKSVGDTSVRFEALTFDMRKKEAELLDIKSSFANSTKAHTAELESRDQKVQQLENKLQEITKQLSESLSNKSCISEELQTTVLMKNFEISEIKNKYEESEKRHQEITAARQVELEIQAQKIQRLEHDLQEAKMQLGYKPLRALSARKWQEEVGQGIEKANASQSMSAGKMSIFSEPPSEDDASRASSISNDYEARRNQAVLKSAREATEQAYRIN